MIELATYRYLVNEALNKAGYAGEPEHVEMTLRTFWMKGRRVRDCVADIVASMK